MFKDYKFKIYYNVNGSGQVSEGENEHFSLNTIIDDGKLKLEILPKVEMELVHAEIAFDYKFAPKACVLANGYQSWTMTKECDRNDKQLNIFGFIRSIPAGFKLASIFGDYQWKAYPKKKGIFHGYTFGYVREGKSFELIGSLSEKQGYTIINFDMNQNNIVIEKEVEGKTISQSYCLFDLVAFKGAYDEVFDKYFSAMQIPAPRVSHTCGYTSWYNYFTNINEEIIIRDLNGLDRIKDKIDIFQIDDGYQAAVGDWQTTDKEKFPKGMKFIADSIHEKGYKAGLWLAPFYAQKGSKVATEHPDWLVRMPNGKEPTGFVGGRMCHTLDFYNPECAAYLKGVFKTVLQEWGFDMVKLDFLCAECLVPRNNKTRGEIMCEAMDFLRECVGDKYILGCGVPLGPSFGKVDYCRIGSDVDIHFKPRWYLQCTNAEVVSTQTAIKNTIFRRGLNNRAFGNDPDVFFMRDVNLKFTESEKALVADINKTFGTLLFVSDNVGDFSQKQMDFINKAYTKTERKIEFVDYLGGDDVKIYFTENGEKKVWSLNWLTGINDIKPLK